MKTTVKKQQERKYYTKQDFVTVNGVVYTREEYKQMLKDRD